MAVFNRAFGGDRWRPAGRPQETRRDQSAEAGCRHVEPKSTRCRSFPIRAPPEESAELEERRHRVLAVLRSMPEEYREPISLRYLGGADYETIGRQLGLSNGSLRGLLNRGMAKLREKLKGLDI